MKKLFTLVCLVLFVQATWARPVAREDAQKTAVTFYRLNNPNGILDPVLKSTTVRSENNTATFYIFRFVSGGFVLVSADDAVIPVLGYSFENDMPEIIENPATEMWLKGYSRDIAEIVDKKLDNTETLKEWNSIAEEKPMAPSYDVAPLLQTLWDQGCYYNTMCPADGAGQCGHVWTGCVATAMAQIMKYHAFPPQGVGQHSYTHPTYGVQSANFGTTTYNWASMPNSVNSSNPAVATIMYHAGVSVNMNYGTSGSGAYSEDVPQSLLNYFNYRPEIEIKYKNNYTNVEDFKALLRSELDQSRPMYYSGDDGSTGHAWVCDGYRMSDGKFHMNWGWSGSANGYYAIGSLNPSGYYPNLNNAVIIHIKPYNPNLIVRITRPVDNAVIGVGYTAYIKAKVLRGSATMMKIFIDSVEKFSVAGDSIEFTWPTSTADLGVHLVQAYAYNATDTVYYKVKLNVAEWISQASGFTTASRAITYLSAVDSNIVWGTAADANNPTGACSDFTRTTDGGNTWHPGTITNTSGLASAMIFAMDSLKAYVAMYRVSGSKPMGIYVTTDGGLNWTRQTTASYNNANSFPDVVHFFNSTDGVAIGDPINNHYELYTTTDGGTTWTVVPSANIPAPLSGEFGVVGYYSAVHDTVWFGTNKGRVYKSVDKGLNWTVATASAMSNTYVKPVFRNGNHGLLIDESSGNGKLCESFDGGATWNQVNFSGPNYSADLSYVPGTSNIWVRSGYTTNLGCAYSFDGGHNWSDFVGTTGATYYQLAWVNNHCGWAGGINTNTTEDGAYKFIGNLHIPLPVPQNVNAVATNHDVLTTWAAPTYDPGIMTLQGYNISRNGTKLNPTLITTTSYTDNGVPVGQFVYCVTAVYDIGESLGNCDTVDVAVGIKHSGEQPLLMIYPNPAHGNITLQTSGTSPLIRVFNQSGAEMITEVKQLAANRFTVDISDYPAGIYLISVVTSEGISRSKLVVY